MSEEEKYGTKAIRENELVAVDNDFEEPYLVRLTIPEFTCLCPRSGFPDFATICIEYVPGKKCVELKSLKLYINGFRNLGIYHEQVPNTIGRDLVALLDPVRMLVAADFHVRGNIKTIVEAHYERGTGWAVPALREEA
jgi:7-cyano-7-deazaguanine reductase